MTLTASDSPPVLTPPPKHPLRNRAFRLLWTGNAISWTGDQFYIVALPWLVLSLTASSITLASVSMLAAIPRAVLMFFGGALTDRISPRCILMFTATARMLLVTAVAALAFLHKLDLLQLYCLALGFGVADAFSYPAASALLPSLVEPEQLAAANSVSQATLQITTLALPGPVGVFIQVFGIAWAFLLDGISFLAIPILLARLPDPAMSVTPPLKRHMIGAISDGLYYVRADVALRSLMLVTAALNLSLAGPMSVGLAVIAKDRFGTPSAFGLLMSSFAAGSLVGMLCAGLVPHRRRGRTLLAASALVGFCVMPLGAIGHMPIFILNLVLIGGIAAFLNVQLIGWFQQRTAHEFMGRVMSVLMFASVGLMPVSLAIAGIALKASVPGMFFGSGAIVLVVTLLAAFQRAVRTID